MFDVNTFIGKQYGKKDPTSSPLTLAPEEQSGGFESNGVTIEKTPEVKPQKIASNSQGGFDVNNFIQTTYKQPEEDKFLGIFSGKGGKEGAFADFISAGTKYVIDKGKGGKDIAKGIFDDMALGIGKIQGWCGEYASRLSTAARVGDNWLGKIDKVDHRDKARAGDKLALPLGVKKDENGKVTGYGHMLVALTDEDENGNVVYAQSNADGRQEKGLGPGVASLVTYNTKDLQKRYGQNFGFITGKLKVNPFLDKAIKTFAPSVSSPPSESNTGGFTDLLTKGASFVTDRLKGAVEQSTKANAQKPPASVNINDPKALANYVLENNITNLQDKAWWNSNPAKKQAFAIIELKQKNPNIRDADIHVAPLSTSSFVQGDLNQKTGSNPFLDLVGSVFDPNGYITGKPNTDLVGNAKKAAEAAGKMRDEAVDVVYKKANETGKFIKQRVEEKILSDPNANFIFKGLGKATYSVGQGLEELTGGETGLETPQYVKGLKDTFFGAAGFTPAGGAFYSVTSLPGVEQAADATFAKMGELNNWTLDQIGVKKGEFRDLLETGLELGEFWLAHKVGGKAIEKGKDIALNKNVKYSPQQVKAAYAEITTGRPDPKVPEALRTKAKELLQASSEGVKQREMLTQSYKQGITIKEARGFVDWFNKFFKNANPKAATPEFAGLLTDGKKVAQGEISPVEFTKKAREVMAKGESATLRDELATVKPTDLKLYEQKPGTQMAIEKYSTWANQLADFQKNGAQKAVQIGPKEEPILDIQTYTYSDNKTGVKVTLNTDETSIEIPMSGKFASPREAVQAVVPLIEKNIGGAWDTKSEQVRVSLDKLKETKFKEIPEKGEIMPWEDNYSAPTPVAEPAKLSKEKIQSQIDQTVDDYIELALKPGMGQGVTPGGLVRDPRTGDVIGRTGRQSNNAQWYSEAYKKFGRAPSKAQLKEIAIDHLMNGVSDRTIGELPPDKNFRTLMQALQTAKSEKALITPEAKSVSGSTVSTPESRTESSNKPIESLGKEKLSKNITRVQDQLSEEFKGLVKYREVNTALDAAKAVEFTESNLDFATKVALGMEKAPEGISRSAIDHAVAEKAKATGDFELQARVETAHSLHLTRAGQEIALEKGRITDNSPENFIKQVMDYRMNGAAKYSGTLSVKEGSPKKKFMERVVKETENLKEQIKEKTIPKKKVDAIKKAQDILDMLTCKV